MYCHGSKYVVGVAHARATAVVATPREHRALLVAKAAAIYYLVVPTIVNRYRGIDVLRVNESPCRQRTLNAVTPSGAFKKYDQCTC